MEMPLNSVMTIRINYLHEAYADRAYNVFHYQLKTATVISTGLPLATVPLAEKVLPGAAQAVAEVWSAPWSVFASEDVGVEGATAQKVYPGDRSTAFTYSFPAPITGIVVSQSLPMQDAMTLLKKTAFGQRWGLGRVFVPGIPEVNANGGVVDNTARDALNDLSDVLANTLAYTVEGIAYNIVPVVTNVPTTGFPRVNPTVTGELSDTIIKTQRRRRPGKGK